LKVVLKKNSQKANPMTLEMLRLVAIEALYHMRMMFLQTNKFALLSQLQKNPSKFDLKLVKIHKTKIESLLGDSCSPNAAGFGPKQDFETMEYWVGHDLFVKAIAFYTKNAKNKMVFSKQIPKRQWAEFETEEMAQNRPKLNLFLPANFVVWCWSWLRCYHKYGTSIAISHTYLEIPM
jgi:hypothetical protein